ncbi:MAG TPA: S8 family serine peptidase [Kofleriaceae bacterium]
MKVSTWCCSALILAACSSPSLGLDGGPPRSEFSFQGDDVVPKPAVDAVEAKALVQRHLRAGETLDNSYVVHLDGIGQDVVIAVATTNDNSRTFAILDGDRELLVDALKTFEDERYQARFGKLTAALYRRQRGLAEDAVIHVDIRVDGDWINADSGKLGLARDPHATADEVSAYTRAHADAQRERVAAAKKEVQRFLADSKIVERKQYPGLPVIDVELPVALLRSEQLNTLRSVIEITAAGGAKPDSFFGFAAHQSLNEQAIYGAGGCAADGSNDCDGVALTVGIWEEGCDATSCGAIASQNSRIAQRMTGRYSYEVTPSSCSTDADCGSHTYGGDPAALFCRKIYTNSTTKYCVFDHPTWVVGALGMVGPYTYDDSDATPERNDNAPGVMFPSVGTYDLFYNVANIKSDDSALDSINWLIDTKPTVFINRSQGLGDPTAGAVADWAIRHNGFFFTMAAGNGGATGGSDECFNVHNGICVGANTYFSAYNAPSTHRIATYSSWMNYHAGRERPHLVAPGGFTSVLGLFLPSPAYDPTATMGMTTKRLDTTAEGTSFASPIVLSAVIKEFEYAGFFSVPGTSLGNKVGLLASTVDSNADGAIGLANTWSASGDAKDGAGQIDFSLMKQMMDGHQYNAASINDAGFTSCGTGCRQFTIGSATIPQGKKLRVALAWNSCSLTRTTAAFLNNDLDLWVTKTPACGSNIKSVAVDSEVEMVEASSCTIASGPATVGIQVRIANGGMLNACGTETTEPLAVAWSLR